MIWDENDENYFDLNLLYSSFITTYSFEINKSTNVEKYEPSHKVHAINEACLRQKNYPTRSVIIIVSSNATLALILQDLKNSIRWNHEAKFFIVNNNADDSCDIASGFLKTVWAFDILSAVYLCRTVNNQLILYTFNPYSHYIPPFWEIVTKDVFIDVKTHR